MFVNFNKKYPGVYTKAILFPALLLLYFILGCSSITAQNEMLIEQIAGRFVVRENFDTGGVFLNKQTFESSEIIAKSGYYEIEIITELFDKDKKPIDRYATTYRCKPAEGSIMVMAFPFSNPKSKETEISTTSKNFKVLYDLRNLEDIELEMSFDSGLLSLFGSKSIIKIYDRNLEGNKIKSKVNIKAYALGFRIKQLNYVVTEKLNNKGQMTFQKFTEADGSYFIMNYK